MVAGKLSTRLVALCAVGLAVGTPAVSGCKGWGKAKTPIAMPVGTPAKLWHADPNMFKRQGGGGPNWGPIVPQDDPGPGEDPAPTPTAAGQAASGRTLNGDPHGITRETLNRSIQGAMGSLAACFSNISQDPMVSVSFEADPSGRPSLVRVKGAPADAESCIRNVIQGIRFPGFEGRGVQVDLPLSFHRVATKQTQAPPQQAQGPGEAPLFLQP